MHPNAALIDRFYKAFAAHDAEAMAACYHPDVHFSDPVFTDLRGGRAGDMWRMLNSRAKDLVIVHSGVAADDREGKAHWEADYTFTATGLPVHNVIDARFTFRDGKIVRHVDTFDLHRWATMALGLKGRLLGWLPPVQNGIRAKAAAGLDAWIAKRA
jgi:ketosteroid isomerase-like protein